MAAVSSHLSSLPLKNKSPHMQPAGEKIARLALPSHHQINNQVRVLHVTQSRRVSRFTACCSNAMAKSWMPAEAWLLSHAGFWAPSYNCTHWCGGTAAVSQRKTLEKSQSTGSEQKKRDDSGLLSWLWILDQQVTPSCGTYPSQHHQAADVHTSLQTTIPSPRAHPSTALVP